QYLVAIRNNFYILAYSHMQVNKLFMVFLPTYNSLADLYEYIRLLHRAQYLFQKKEDFFF
ncbi:hypothetical protein, partial [Niallia taxi]|uniref:hypothetical protein n=1 Tax=Niallia taxi TaxID=2499688 RepID=UPI003009858E